MNQSFTIRVYGVLISQEKKVLLLKESYNGKHFIKFPGGGLQFGEGTIECLKREFKEELNLEIEILKHFYTTDFFQSSAFNPAVQVISVYYLINGENFNSEIKINHSDNIGGAEISAFEWIQLKDFSENNLTFPIDKTVAQMIKKEIR